MHELIGTDLVKRYGSKTVVDGVTVSIRSGEVVGLLGPNGAGKTTTFYMILGLVQCDAGDIILDKQSLKGVPLYQRARLGLGYLPQEPSAFRKLSVVDNLRLVLEPWRLSPTALNDQIRSTLESMGILHLSDV